MDFTGSMDHNFKNKIDNYQRTKIDTMRKILCLLIFSFFTLVINAQNTEMADTMKSNGKIYVVIAVMLTILAGIILYLIRLDRKITKLEKNK
jgi:uncharacterized membrane protein YvlD (DUF360 family)